ncbi:hypothetical protein F5879DRAFT_194071 [Lentinula edodes]|nr:hypothetical protein F5879DRAFT_194071 [Lentinula edodes]
MPAIAKLMRMKGVNGYSPCRMCLIHGIADPAKPRTLYTPLHRNNGDPYRPRDLPLRSHRQFIEQARSVLNDESDALSREYGINGIPLLASISSLSIPHSFPFDFMHLVGNIVPSLVAHWTGTFKEMTNGNEDYIIDPAEWEEIGRACSSSGDTVPTAFGSRVPNIATERYQFKTENWFTFLMFLGPALLHGHLATPYYRHFLKLVNIFNLCLKYFMTNNEIEQLENAVIQWVEDYERLYYCYDLSRVSACTLPIHSMLHIPVNVSTMGPLWCYWNFPTERFCGTIVRAVSSRKYPYTTRLWSY